MMNTDLAAYYKNRAQEYEKIYLKPERQADLQAATHILQDLFAGKQVLEIACGTGYWTEKIAQTAASILATDLNETVLEIARQKDYPSGRVAFQCADLYDFQTDTPFEALFGGFIWSHISLQEIRHFLDVIDRLVRPGGLVVLMDNRFVAGSNLPISKTDAYHNTYQTRTLDDGSTHLVLKNFPDARFLTELLENRAAHVKVQLLDYYWILQYQTI
jgi:2-polyprenyl-3-methyl-5-hydroxy-6-metoxy-1,4-benzoquinol methylase